MLKITWPQNAQLGNRELWIKVSGNGHQTSSDKQNSKKEREFSRENKWPKHLSPKFWDPRDLGMLGVISICFGQSPQIPFGYAFGFYYPCCTRPLWFLYHYLLSFPFHKHSNKRVQISENKNHSLTHAHRTKHAKAKTKGQSWTQIHMQNY